MSKNVAKVDVVGGSVAGETPVVSESVDAMAILEKNAKKAPKTVKMPVEVIKEKKAPAHKKDGVCKEIIRVITEEGPVTRDEILTKLSAKFADRNPNSMRGTIYTLVYVNNKKDGNVKIILDPLTKKYSMAK